MPTSREVRQEFIPAIIAIPLALAFGYLAHTFDFDFGWGGVLNIVLLVGLLGPWLWLQAPRSTWIWISTLSVLILFSAPVVMELGKDQIFGPRHRHEYAIALSFPEYCALVATSFALPILLRLSLQVRLRGTSAASISKDKMIPMEPSNEGLRLSDPSSILDLVALTSFAAVLFAALRKSSFDELGHLLRMLLVLDGLVIATLTSVLILNRLTLLRLVSSYISNALIVWLGWWMGISVRRTEFADGYLAATADFWQQIFTVSLGYKLRDPLFAAAILGLMPSLFAVLLNRCGLTMQNSRKRHANVSTR